VRSGQPNLGGVNCSEWKAHVSDFGGTKQKHRIIE
jgi:hypothetical protein